MKKPYIEDYNLEFGDLSERNTTDMIVIHHTGNPWDQDLSAVDIHNAHQAMGWSGIGYHVVIRKNGLIENGRPLDCKGAHSQGDNWHTVGIHLSGNFDIVKPTPYQVESLALFIGWVGEYYNIPIDQATVVGHRDLSATDCPGDFLYNMIPDIIGKALWYQQNT